MRDLAVRNSSWRDYILRLAWERLGIPQEELESVAEEMDVWSTLLGLLPPRPSPGQAVVKRVMASVGENPSPIDRVRDNCNQDPQHVETTPEVKSSTVDDPSCTAAGNNHPEKFSHITLHLSCPDCKEQCPPTESKSFVENSDSESQPKEGNLKGHADTHVSSTGSEGQVDEMGQAFSGCITQDLHRDDDEESALRDRNGERNAGKQGGKEPIDGHSRRDNPERHRITQASMQHNRVQTNEPDEPRFKQNLPDPDRNGERKIGQQGGLEPKHRQSRPDNPQQDRITQANTQHNRVQTNAPDEPLLKQTLPDPEEDIYRSKATVDILAIGERKELVDYSCEEWKGSTAKTRQIKKAYLELSSRGYYDMRRVRGDNYCGLRATLFQAFWRRIDIFESFPRNLTEVASKLNTENKEFIDKWTFANREVKNRGNHDSLVICLQNLQNEWLKAKSHSSTQADAEIFCQDLFNQLGVTEWRLYEGVKLLMLWKAVELYNSHNRGKEVPLFATLMFARETSLNPLSFLHNHLNHVGSSGGLEQVEMCLLGYALGITIRVFRLYKIGTEEFEVCYPEEQPLDDGGAAKHCKTQEVAIVTEDDRHYNVLLPLSDQTHHVHSKEPGRSPHAS